MVRILSAILLLGNVDFEPREDDNGFDVEILGKTELNAVASLLGVPITLLCQGLTTRTHTVRGQLVRSNYDAMTVSFLAFVKHMFLPTPPRSKSKVVGDQK